MSPPLNSDGRCGGTGRHAGNPDARQFFSEERLAVDSDRVDVLSGNQVSEDLVGLLVADGILDAFSVGLPHATVPGHEARAPCGL